MNVSWHAWCGVIGVLLILLAYLLLQVDRLRPHGLGFQLLNAAGAAGAALGVLFGPFSAALLLITLAWLAISIYGIVIAARRRAVRPG